MGYGLCTRKYYFESGKMVPYPLPTPTANSLPGPSGLP
jgi:hypothetical protein